MKRFLCIPAVLYLALDASAADPRLLRLVAPDAKVVSGIDVDRLKASPFGQFLLAQISLNSQEFSQFMGATGFDPRRDLNEILMAASGGPETKTGLLMIRGSFDPARIAALIKAGGQAPETYKGVEIFGGAKQGKGAQSVAFLDNATAIAGDLAGVKAAIDRQTQPSTLDPALAARVNDLSGSQDIWAVSTLPLSTLAGAVPDRNVSGALQGDLLKAIESTSGGVKFGASVDFSAEAATRSEKDAGSLADVARFLLSLVQSNAPKGPGPAAFLAMLQNVNISTQASSVKLSFSIPESELENLISQRNTPKRASQQLD